MLLVLVVVVVLGIFQGVCLVKCWWWNVGCYKVVPVLYRQAGVVVEGEQSRHRQAGVLVCWSCWLLKCAAVVYVYMSMCIRGEKGSA